MTQKLRLPFLMLVLSFALGGHTAWAQYAGSGVFNKISSIDDLTDGYYIIANATGLIAMNNTHGTFFAHESITPTEDAVLNPATNIVWKIETNGGGRSIYSEDTEVYVSYTGTGNNAQAVASVTADNQRWGFTFVSGNFSVSNLAIPTRFLQYNAGAPRFACYLNTQQNLTLYKLDESGPPNDPEPTNHATDFQSSLNGLSSIDLSWTDAVGENLPFGYLILANTTNIFVNPVDGEDPVTDADLSDGVALVKVTQGVQSYSFNNLASETTYYFRIYAYSNFGENIDFKTDGTIPFTTITTPVLPCIFEDFTLGTPTGWQLDGATTPGGLLEIGGQNGSVIFSAVDKPESLSFDLSRTTNTTAKTLYVEVSTSGVSGTYEIIATYNHGNTTSGGTINVDLDLSAYTFFDNVYIRLRKESSTTSPWRIDNVVVDCNDAFNGVVWNEGQWFNGTPDITTPVLILDNYTTTTDLAAASLTLNSGTLTVASGNTLTVAGAIVNNANAANFVVANDANLIQTSDVANTGDITVNRNSQALLRLDYTLWSSPVAGQNLKAFSPETLTNRFYVYDEAATEGNTTDNVGTYVSIINETNEGTYNFEAAHGYLIRTPNTFSEDVPAVFNGTFVGTPNNGDFTVALSNVNQGFNLVGNPYPSSIALDALFANNANIESSVYFWRKTNGAAGTGYITANNLGYTYPDNSEVADANINIRPGQGFFVKATAATNVVFNNDMRTANSSSIFFRSNDERHRFWLSLMAEDVVLANTLVGYASGATQGIDAGFDSKPFGADYLTSLIGDEAYAIQGRGLPFDTTDTVALQMIAPTAGTYSIALSQFDGLFADGQKIYLQDALEGTTFDLTSGTYTFNTIEGIVNDRFTIVYENQPLSVSDLNHAAVVVYHNQGQLTVASSQVALQEVSVFDIQGRLLFQSNNINANSIEVPKTQAQGQILLVRITTVDGITSTRKTIY